ncbi:hypothetical protein MASR2M29_00240 [Spirochaetota bacterium]
MPEKETSFITVVFELFAIAFVAGFSIALFSIRNTGLLPKFFLLWELVNAVLYMAVWAPAILLSSAALSAESTAADKAFADTAKRLLLPAFVLAAIVSIFYLLVVPGLEKTKHKYENQSWLFKTSIELADQALKEGRIEDANNSLLNCIGIDPKDERFIELAEQIQSQLLKQRLALEQEGQDKNLSLSEKENWGEGNRFYLEALKARDEGRIFDAHYLAKRSIALDSKRPEVKALVEETWQKLQELPTSQESLDQERFYAEKLRAYMLFQERNYLEAYRLFQELYKQNRQDADVNQYMAESAKGLSTIAFFIDEDEKAFRRSDNKPLSISLHSAADKTQKSGRQASKAASPNTDKSNSAEYSNADWSLNMSASGTAIMGETIYFRDLILEISADDKLVLNSKFARLNEDILVVRAVDRNNPQLVWDPVYTQKPDSKSRIGNSSDYAIVLPAKKDQIASAMLLSSEPESIPVKNLLMGLGEAKALSMDIKPLLFEISKRSAYPFVVIILVMLGTGLGLRFRATEPIGSAFRLLTAPIFALFSIPALKAAKWLLELSARLMVSYINPDFFIGAWLGFLAIITAISLFAAAAMSGKA